MVESLIREVRLVIACKPFHSFLDALFKQQRQVFLIKIGLFACFFFAYIKIARWTIFFINVFTIKSTVMLQLIYCAKLQVI